MINTRPLTAMAFSAALLLSLTGCGDSDSDSSGQTTPTTASTSGTTAPADAIKVDIKNYDYSPDPVTIKVGQTVTWTNQDSVTHTVTSGANSKSDGKYDHSLAPGDSWSWTYETAGTFDYYCKPHPNMVAKVIVQ